MTRRHAPATASLVRIEIQREPRSSAGASCFASSFFSAHFSWTAMDGTRNLVFMKKCILPSTPLQIASP